MGNAAPNRQANQNLRTCWIRTSGGPLDCVQAGLHRGGRPCIGRGGQREIIVALLGLGTTNVSPYPFKSLLSVIRARPEHWGRHVQAIPRGQKPDMRVAIAQSRRNNQSRSDQITADRTGVFDPAISRLASPIGSDNGGNADRPRSEMIKPRRLRVA